jgi:hypothetical protein
VNFSSKTNRGGPNLLEKIAESVACLRERQGVATIGVALVEKQEYRYEFLHQGLIRAIIAEIASNAGVSALYWRDGLCAYEKTTRSRALIEQRMDERCWSGRIVVQTRGGRPKELLARLCKLVEEQQERIGLDAARSVPKIPASEERRRGFPGVVGRRSFGDDR